ncbi:hypothetical protein GCM10007094_44380 [Pseudovibrio japonicus]|uniref:Uncharacterized protein n=2 Tax=Pseudovibrio japonicus TaxID=366534 RepID=A0ABQ3ETV6_9HYPH|nr:hypothetical protein GCM10007094_44380 [Pseudovibrio japonicus]
MELHWRAKLELQLSTHFGGAAKHTKPVGPASAVIFELLRRRGYTRIFGQYDAGTIISEPAGWLVVNDKLALM